MGFPTKNDHFRVFWGYHHLRKPPYGGKTPGHNDSWEAKDHPWEALGGMGGGRWDWPTGEIPQIAGAQNPPLKLS